MMLRIVSVLLRKRKFLQDEKKSLLRYHHAIETQKSLPAYVGHNKKLLIIRLDDIGDYLLFRNSLACYKQSPRWQGYRITLLGNEAWKDMFVRFDAHTTDAVMWVRKKEYLQSEAYRQGLWQQLRAEGFETVICASATRPLLLDDACRLAAGAPYAIGFANLTPHIAWQPVSDAIYTSLYHPPVLTHEFFLNQQFANWCCGTAYCLAQPEINICKKSDTDYILCNIGASTASKRWPVKQWIHFIRVLKQKQPALEVRVSGGLQDIKDTAAIAAATGATNAGVPPLDILVTYVASAVVVVSNDTMMAHLAASCGVPVVIIANGGNNFVRFTNYAEAGIRGVHTVYPPFFSKRRKRVGDAALQHHMAASADIGTIKAGAVWQALLLLLPQLEQTFITHSANKTSR